VRVGAEAYRGLDLRAHALLADAPLHDVWAVDLPGGETRTLLDLRDALGERGAAGASPAVRLLFRLRGALGSWLGWDREPVGAPAGSYLGRLSDADREASRVVPGTREGPFRVLYVTPRESVSEVRNATVHAFSVFALAPRPGVGQRLYLAVHVRPVGRITAWYMRLIDPFRHLVVYSALLRHIRAAWTRSGDA